MIDVVRFIKVLGLLDSPNEGERAAALARATAILVGAKKTWLDVPSILAQYAGGSTEAKERARSAAAAAAAAQKAREREAALAPNAMERAVNDAVAPFIRTDLDGAVSRKTLRGWLSWGDPVPEDVGAAVRAALPLPTTIAAAKDEVDAWRSRNSELVKAARQPHGENLLSLGCSLREQIVHDMMTRDLRAVSLSDALVRQRAIWDSGFLPTSEEAAAMIADLEHLVPRSVPEGHSVTATARRSEVLRLLSDVQTAALPDREIARRTGVSPQTVGNIRRRASSAH